MKRNKQICYLLFFKYTINKYFKLLFILTLGSFMSLIDTSGSSGYSYSTAGPELKGATLVSPEISIITNNTKANFQSGRITGIVTDVGGNPIPGVTVHVKGTNVGALSDNSGKYIIDNVPPDAILVFSFIGMITQEIRLEGREVIDVILEEDVIGLEEVVVVGYGTQKKVTLTGSVVSIGGDEVLRTPVPNVSNSVAGLLPGLIALNRSGQPGSDLATILIRGNSTTGNNNPLVLVDGIPQDGWQRINSNDIESISVLKDAAAAIYGVQAANGVVLITTKRGTTGKPVFDFSYNQSFVQPTRIPKMASSATLAMYGNEYLSRTGFEEKWSAEQIQKFRDGSDPLRYPNTNWPKECLKDFALHESANLNIRGGTDIIKYSLSGSFQHQDDIIKNGIHDFKGYSIRNNIDAAVTNNITLSLDLNVGLDDRVTPRNTNWYYIYASNPQYPVYWPGGYPSNPPSDYGDHPMVTNTGASGYAKQVDKRFSGKFSYDINIPWIEGLGLDGYFVYNDSYYKRKTWSTPWKYYGYNFDTGKVIEFKGGTVPKPQLEELYSNSNSNLIHFKIKYQRQFTDHFVNAFIAGEQSEGKSDNFSAFRRDFMSAALDEIFAGSASNMNTTGSSSQSARQNLFGRLSYNFQEKYLFDFNFRYDGSYRFPKDSRWGFFPGVSAAYRISKESFMSNLTFLDDLKFRASYGQIGNDAISAFQYLQEYNLRSVGYHFGAPVMSSPQAGIYAGVSPNPGITWEVATIANAGVDAMFLNNLFGIGVDIFKQHRTNILTTATLKVPYYTGLSLPSQNIGIVDNKGIEIELSHRNTISNNKFTYRVSGNIAYAKSKVIDVAEAEDVPDYQKAEGHMLGAGLFYIATGIIRTQEELESIPVYPGTIVGDLKYKDIDDDGKITAADRIRLDRSIIPQLTYGFRISARYSRFDLYANFAGQGNAWWSLHHNARVDLNAPAELLDNRYTPGSMDSKYPWIPQYGNEISDLESTFWLQNAAFLRLKTLEFSYTLPENLFNKININRFRVYLNGSNLLTFTKLKWFDPEGSASKGAFYPQSKIFNLGVQVTF